MAATYCSTKPAGRVRLRTVIHRFVLCAVGMPAVLLPATAHAQASAREAAERLLGPAFREEIDAVATVVALQIATFPIGTSSGGFLLKPQEGTGQPVNARDSFGPAFAERAPTLGKPRVFAVGVNIQSTRYVSFEGLRL